jgi:hypothetical protein
VQCCRRRVVVGSFGVVFRSFQVSFLRHRCIPLWGA